MSEEKPATPNVADELARMQGEEILPVEKKLVLWSLLAGVALLAVLTWLSRTLFPS